MSSQVRESGRTDPPGNDESSDEEDFNVRLSYFAGRQKAEIVISDSLPRQVQVTSAAE
jgi:hypothetical protein